jgi:hypothetical protein
MRNFLFTKIQKKIGIPVRFTSLTKLFLHVKSFIRNITAQPILNSLNSYNYYYV